MGCQFYGENAMSKHVVAALQIGSDPKGKAATLEKILSYEEQIKAAGADLVVMPEALLGSYPKGEIFGTYMGYRLDEGRDKFRDYFKNAITDDGEESHALAELSARTGASLVVGCIEQTPHALYCAAFFYDPEKGLVAKHRKVMPTAAERLIWGNGDGSYLPVVPSKAGRIGAAICWENHMPLLRAYMYDQDLEIYCAPTVAVTDVWQASMRHIAHEGRCFLVCAVQYQPTPEALGIEVPHWDPKAELMRGGSVIIDPQGNVLAGPFYHEEGLLTAEIETDEILRARYDLDVSGHYARPDIFKLTVDARRKPNVEVIHD